MPFGFLGTQLQRAAGRLGAGPAVDAGQVACLSCFPDHNKRSLIKVQFHVGFCVLPGKSVVADLSFDGHTSHRCGTRVLHKGNE